VALGCPKADALPLLTQVLLAGDRPSAEDLARVEEACRLLPGRFDVKLNLAEQYVKAGQRDVARLRLSEVAGQNADPQLAQVAARRLAGMDYEEAGGLGKKGMDAFRRKAYPEALAWMDPALERATDSGQKQNLQGERDRMKILIQFKENPRLCRGGSRSLTFQGVHLRIQS